MKSHFVLLVFLASSSMLVAAETKPEVLKLWPSGIVGPKAETSGEERPIERANDRLVAGKKVIRLGNVSSPEIHVYHASGNNRTRTAVVVCPGGGFSILAWDLEGTEVAQWLNSLGVTAVVLKYRVPTRGLPAEQKHLGPVLDAQRALALTRTLAEKWQLDPKRIGIMGFSAGGETAARTAILNGKALDAKVGAESCRADFALLVYPAGIIDKEGKLQSDYQVTKQSPPMFFAHAADDRVKCENSVALFLALRQVQVAAELHIYRDGGHGYGLRKSSFRVTKWPEDAAAWLKEMKFLP